MSEQAFLCTSPALEKNCKLNCYSYVIILSVLYQRRDLININE